MLCRKLTLIGVGLLGGSLGMAAKERGLAGVVFGHVRRRERIRECLCAGAADHVTMDPMEAVAGADLIVLCTPVGQMRPLVERFLPGIAPGAIVTDVGSVKDGLVQDLEEMVRRRGARFVGSHPMAGSEKTGVANARPGLFENTVCVVTPTRKTSASALRRVKALWQRVGARTITMPPAIHDDLVARSSHLPHILAGQLVNFVLGAGRGKRQAMVCANGFRDTTRVASGSPEMWRDILLANRRRLGRVIAEYIAGLKKLRAALLESDRMEIERFLTAAKKRRDEWVTGTFAGWGRTATGSRVRACL
ncbi:MAG: prephenate dehydrogenase/arogenate dehydrogenase family protein [Verrucomicrobiota bacterium]|nr:prephenate dehydrogenase/arogenate dehydrogenase family protein [Verrucomicrobiota bacterium]